MKAFVARRAVAALAAFVLLTGCSKESSGGRRALRVSSNLETDDSAAGTVDLGSAAYTVVPVASRGRVTGVVRLDGPTPVDTATVTKDQRMCGTRVSGRIAGTPSGLSDVLVWIADVKAGKALPIEKRVELDSEDCVLDPRVQAAVVGSTVNVFNDDRLEHRLVFTRAGTNDTLTVMPFFSDGQIVPSELLAKKPGIVAVTCAMHPWTHGYIAVFDHPYFDVTEKGGKFSIDSLPPGSYTVMIWHEGMAAPIERKVSVPSGGSATLDVPIKLGK
ncbi:MAG: carboxypeptidase regulatory-like domain-containing protein [Gemmatimonadaceae bacterium]